MEHLHFLERGRDTSLAMASDYDLALVAVSLVVASAAGFAAFVVAERIAEAESGRARNLWLWLGASAMGAGIWAMHFVGMLALQLPVEVRYDPWITAGSVLPAIVASAVALAMMSRGSVSVRQLHLCGASMGTGIGAMHYTGMAAMLMNAEMRYDPRLLALSLVVAYALATISLYVGRRQPAAASSRARRRWASAGIMGCAVAGMHFTAMGAVHYFPSSVVCVTGPAALSSAFLAIAVTLVAILILGIAILCALVDQRLHAVSIELRISEERSRMVLDAAGDGIITIDPSGAITTFNRAAASIFGVSPATVLGRNASVLMPADAGAVRDPDGGRSVATDFAALLGRRREITACRWDGSSFPCSLAVTEVGRRGDRHHGFTAILRDLTEQRALETQLLQAQKLESIGQLAAGIAHEINTPSQYVSDNLSFLDDSFRDLAPVLERGDPAARADLDLAFLRDEIPRALASAREGITRVSRIVGAMKEFSHPGSTHRVPVDLNRAIECTVTVASNEWKYVADVELRLDPELPPVPCLAAELNQVLLNVLVNAAQSIGASERVRAGAKGRIRIATRVEAGFCVIEIADDGPGIPEAIRDRIFDPFFTTKAVGKGTGQGLAIARSIVVDKHGGTIAVESVPGGGALFRIRVPLAPAADREPGDAIAATAA